MLYVSFFSFSFCFLLISAFFHFERAQSWCLRVEITAGQFLYFSVLYILFSIFKVKRPFLFLIFCINKYHFVHKLYRQFFSGCAFIKTNVNQFIVSCKSFAALWTWLILVLSVVFICSCFGSRPKYIRFSSFRTFSHFLPLMKKNCSFLMHFVPNGKHSFPTAEFPPYSGFGFWILNDVSE